MKLNSEEICAQIADLEKWKEFPGYGMLPSIIEATFEVKTAHMIGTKIRVLNSDKSTHVEEIYAWNPQQMVGLKLAGFSPPLSRISSHFLEEWHFSREGENTLVKRTFQMFPLRPFTRPFLWIISRFFRRAIERHMNLIAGSS
ncbi:MAG: hypothetical protein H6581_11950 [Bacteroidia bacterium]|nr:hypothetical protein [Bacteroidia bacterium]